MHSEHESRSVCRNYYYFIIQMYLRFLHAETPWHSYMHFVVKFAKNSAESESIDVDCFILVIARLAVNEKSLATNFSLPKYPIKRGFITFCTGIKFHLALSYYATPETQLLYVNDKLVQSIPVIVSTLYTLAISIQSPLPRQHVYWIFFSHYPGRCIPKKNACSKENVTFSSLTRVGHMHG